MPAKTKTKPSKLRPSGHKPTPKDIDDVAPRDRKKYTPKVLAIKCERCGAPKNAPCISDTATKTELRSPHAPRVAAGA